MNIENVLNWIKTSSDEESRIAVKALVEKRKEYLVGGDVIYEEHSKEEIELIREILLNLPAYRSRKQRKGEADCHASLRTGSQ